MDLLHSPYAAAALAFIRENIGHGIPSVTRLYGDRPPRSTRAYRHKVIDRLIAAGLVRNYPRDGRYHLLAVDYPRIAEWEIIDHGIQHSDYFQGCGVAFTRFHNVVTGIGSNAVEAIDDCLEQIAQQTNDIDLDAFERAMLCEEKRTRWPRRPQVSADSEGAYYHVSIRFTVERG